MSLFCAPFRAGAGRFGPFRLVPPWCAAFGCHAATPGSSGGRTGRVGLPHVIEVLVRAVAALVRVVEVLVRVVAALVRVVAGVLGLRWGVIRNHV